LLVRKLAKVSRIEAGWRQISIGATIAARLRVAAPYKV